MSFSLTSMLFETSLLNLFMPYNCTVKYIRKTLTHELVQKEDVFEHSSLTSSLT